MTQAKKKLTPNKRSLLENKKKLVWDSLFYSAQRLDLLIISISGASLYTCSEIIKYLLSKNQKIDCTLKIIILIFTLSIIINILSQKTSAKVHELDFIYLEDQLDDDENDGQSTIDLEENEKKALKFEKLTNTLNELSLVLMLSALFIFIFYVAFTF